MGLVPTTGILATVTKVARTDPDAAAELVRFGLFESLCDQIDDMRPALELDAAALIDSQISKARSAMLRSHVGKALSGQPEPEDQAYAEALAVLEEFAKGRLSGALLSVFNRKHPRNDAGQFVSASTSGGVDPNHEAQTRRKAHQINAKNIVSDWQAQGIAGDSTEVTLHYQKIDPMTGRPVEQGITQLPSNVGNLEADLDRYDKTEGGQRLLVGVSIARGHNPNAKVKNHGAMDALSTVTNDPKALGLGARFINASPGAGDWTDAGEKWNRSSSQGDRQGYRRLQLTGQALNSVSQPGSPGAMIGGLAQLMGDLGPEAEKVLGPGFTRAAYRYRGTERRPDKGMAAGVEYVNAAVAAASNPDERGRAQAYTTVRRLAETKKDSVQHQIADFYAGETGTRDELELAASGDVAAAYLQKGLPDLKVAQLSLASGEIPPSEGVIIDADGHVVSQAQGFKGDHYLPFDLKNLKRLRGGQYVRTRLSGGPTTEDIYTGLLTGARQIKVVSHSGVFTVEFDPDLRGGRRYSDKARKMVGRYEALLGVLAGGQLTREDISPAEQAKLKRQAYGDANWDAEVGEANFQAELKRRRSEASIGVDEEDMEAAALDRAKASPEWRTASPSQRGEIEQEAWRATRDEMGAAAYRMYRLDGPGYNGALKALKQEFPYFLRDVKWEPLPDFNMDRGLPRGDSPRFGPQDKGYVAPDKLHAFDSGRGRGRLVPAEQAQEQGTAPAGAPGAPRAAAATAQTPAPKVTDHMAPGTKFSRKLAIAFNDAFGHLANVPVGGEMGSDWDIEDARGADPLPFAKWIWRKNGSDADRMADWLLKEATPDDKKLIAIAANEFADMAPGITGLPIKPETVDRGAGAVVELTELLDPYETAAPEGDLVTARPKTKNPRPMPFADILVLSTKEKLDAFVAAASHQDKPLAEAINRYEQQGPGAAVSEINDLLEQNPDDPQVKQKLAAAQRAWSFVVTADVVDQLETLDLIGGGAAPKAPAPSPGEPKEPTAKSLSRGSLRPLRQSKSSVEKSHVRLLLQSLTQ